MSLKSPKPAAKPAAATASLSGMDAQIDKALDQVRQYLRVDGGDIQFVSYKDGEVAVRLKGHCAGCMHAQATLKNLVEQGLKEMLGEDKIKKVVNVV